LTVTTSRQQPRPTLEAIGGLATGLRIPLRADDGVVLGRDSLDTPQLAGDPTLSRRHAELRWGREGFVLTDLNSTTGTFANGHPLTGPVRIRYGDTVQVGQTLFELVPEPRTDDRAATPRPEHASRDDAGGVGFGGDLTADRGSRVAVAGRDVTMGGDIFEQRFDPTGIEGTHGIGRALVILSLLLGLAAFASFGYPLVQGFMGTQQSMQQISAAESACDEQFEIGQERAECYENIRRSGAFAVDFAPWIPIGAGLFIGAMVLWIAGRAMSGDDDRHHDR